MEKVQTSTVDKAGGAGKPCISWLESIWPSCLPMCTVYRSAASQDLPTELKHALAVCLVKSAEVGTYTRDFWLSVTELIKVHPGPMRYSI